MQCEHLNRVAGVCIGCGDGLEATPEGKTRMYCPHDKQTGEQCLECDGGPAWGVIDTSFLGEDQLWQPDAQGYEKFASALETQADEMSAAMEAFEGHADVVAGFMCTASWLRRTAKAIRELGK